VTANHSHLPSDRARNGHILLRCSRHWLRLAAVSRVGGRLPALSDGTDDQVVASIVRSSRGKVSRGTRVRERVIPDGTEVVFSPQSHRSGDFHVRSPTGQAGSNGDTLSIVRIMPRKDLYSLMITERSFNPTPPRGEVKGLPAGFRYHDLRHYFASLLTSRPGPP